jgi:hypothetical protein
LPAQVPTVFVSNIRGTDDQEARARWCNDFGFALRADQANLADITEKVKMLQDPDVRKRLSEKCAELPNTTGGQEIAAMLYELAVEQKPQRPKSFTFARLMAQEHINRGLRHVANLGLRRLALVYRFLHPHIRVQEISLEPPIFGDHTTAAELHPLIKSATRYEHMIEGASPNYRKRREEIAFAAYGKQVIVTKSK